MDMADMVLEMLVNEVTAFLGQKEDSIDPL
jgi:hypothetical protein